MLEELCQTFSGCPKQGLCCSIQRAERLPQAEAGEGREAAQAEPGEGAGARQQDGGVAWGALGGQLELSVGVGPR